MKTFLDCWSGAASALFAQALTGEPELTESLPKPLAGESFGFAATIVGDLTGRFAVMLDGTVMESALVGEGMDQKAGWGELLREVAESAVGELQAAAGLKCRIEKFEPISGESKVSCAFQLKTGEQSWTILVRDEVTGAQKRASVEAVWPGADSGVGAEPGRAPGPDRTVVPAPGLGSINSGISPGIELLLDVELDASLRFGCREMPLGEILDLGPGDVVQLDRHILTRNSSHPAGPGRLVLMASAAIAISPATPQREAPALVIHAGDRVIVEEHTAVVDARLEAVAMGSAMAGFPVSVRLSIGGSAIEAQATGPGRAVMREEIRR